MNNTLVSEICNLESNTAEVPDTVFVSCHENPTNDIGHAGSPFMGDTVKWVDLIRSNEWREALSRGDFVFSPIEWNGLRLNANFKCASFIVLDFDNGKLSLDDAHKLFSNFSGLIYTTKSHQKEKGSNPPCDRFRVILAPSHRIESLDHWEMVTKYMSELLGTDKSTCIGTAMFRGSDTAQFIELNTSHDAKCVSVLACELGWLRNHPMQRANTSITVSGGSIATVKPNKPLTKWQKRDLDNIDKENSFARYYQAYVNCFMRRCLSQSKVKASMLEIDEFEEWLQRHPHQRKGLDKTIQSAWTFAVTHGRHVRRAMERQAQATVTPLASRTPIEVVDTSGITLGTAYSASLARLAREMGITIDSTSDAAYRLLQEAFEQRTKSIVAVPCGAGKSLGSSAYIAAMASPLNRYWIVRDTIDAALGTVALLKQLGASSIGLLSGFESKRCQTVKDAALTSLGLPVGLSKNKALPNREWRKMYDRKSTPCHSCPAKMTCPFARTIFQFEEEMSRDIVVMSHEKFLRLAESNRVPANVTICIDEAPAVYQSYSLTLSDAKKIREVVESMGHACMHVARCHVHCFGGGTAIDEYVIPDELQSKLRKYIHATSDETLADLLSGYLHFFRHAQKRQVMYCAATASKAASLSWMRDRVSWSLPNRMVVLDASACVSLVPWDGFSILKALSHDKVTYENVTIHPVHGNPTLSHIDRVADSYFERARKVVEESKAKLVFLPVNKTDSMKDKTKDAALTFEAWCISQGVKVSWGSRGKDTRGSNAYRESDAAVIAMSLFSSVQDVAPTCGN